MNKWPLVICGFVAVCTLCNCAGTTNQMTPGNAVDNSKTAAPEIEFHNWHQGEPAQRLIRKEDGFCALTAVTGHFQGGGEGVRVYIGDDGYWYIGGHSMRAGVAAQCIVVHYNHAEKN